MKNLDEVCENIVKKLNGVASELAGKGAGREPWTTAVKIAICKLGSDEKFYVTASGCDGEQKYGEWLYDICWLECESNNDRWWLQNAPVVFECEWGKPFEVDNDFDKLLLARAELRVMIFGEGGDDYNAITQTADRLCERIKKFTAGSDEDQYLLVGYDDKGYDDKVEKFHGFRANGGKQSTPARMPIE